MCVCAANISPWSERSDLVVAFISFRHLPFGITHAQCSWRDTRCVLQAILLHHLRAKVVAQGRCTLLHTDEQRCSKTDLPPSCVHERVERAPDSNVQRAQSLLSPSCCPKGNRQNDDKDAATASSSTRSESGLCYEEQVRATVGAGHVLRVWHEFRARVAHERSSQ